MALGIKWIVSFVSAVFICVLLLAYVSYFNIFDSGMGLLVQGVVTVNPNVTSYEVRLATFGPRPPQFGGRNTIVGPMVSVNESMCGESPLEPGALNGSVAVVRRGSCSFAEKVLGLQDAGALAVIVGNDRPGGLFTMFGSGPAALVEIPAVSMDKKDCDEIETSFNGWNVAIWSQPEELPIFEGMFVLIARPLLLLALLATFLSISMCADRARKWEWKRVVFDLPVHQWNGQAQIYHCTECIVCLEDFELGAEVTTLPCNHEFHAECIRRWLLRQSKGECPICKRSVSSPSDRVPLIH